MNQTSRRNFLKTSGGTIAAMGIGAGPLRAAPLRLPIGLQLYSVRDLLAKDFNGTLKKVAAGGYKEVEAAGYYNRTAAEFRHSMDLAGLRCVSTHHSLGELRPQLDKLIEYGHALGLDYIICPWPARRGTVQDGALTLDDWRWVASEFNRIGEIVKAAGMSFGYHNHDIEFAAIDGVVVFDELLRLTDPKLVVFEMDCGWVVATGHKPLEYLKRAPERFPLLHVKDVVRGANGEYLSTVLGRGVIDYRTILPAARALKHYFIEQEDFDMDPIAAIRLDAEYMRNLNL